MVSLLRTDKIMICQKIECYESRDAYGGLRPTLASLEKKIIVSNLCVVHTVLVLVLKIYLILPFKIASEFAPTMHCILRWTSLEVVNIVLTDVLPVHPVLWQYLG